MIKNISVCTLALSAISLASILLVLGCGNNPKSDTSTSKNIANSSNPPKETASAATTQASSKAQDEAEKKVSDALDKVKLDKQPNSLVILSVNSTPVTLGDYRRQFVAQQQQVEGALGTESGTREELLNLAKERNITLNAEEKKKLLDRVHSTTSLSKTPFSKYLKDNKMTQEQFNSQVLEIGLACKAANELIKEHLVHEIVNRELLCAAATTNGFSKEAFNKYVTFKSSPEYKQTLRASGLTEEEVKSEFIKNELCTAMIDKIRADAKPSDFEMQKFYNLNKDHLQHGERIRLSQILISAPSKDTDFAQSISTQIKHDNPKITDEALKGEVKKVEGAQHQKAQMILGRALKGDDFATLANDYSQDPVGHAEKNGGDMGFQNESQMLKPFLDKVKLLRPGQVYPEVVTSALGYHIIKETAKEGPGTLPFDEVKEKIRRFLIEQKAQEAVMQWLTNQQKDAKIELANDLASLPQIQK